MSISVLITAELVPGRRPCWALTPHALCAGSGWTGWRCAVAAVSELGSSYFFHGAEAFSLLLSSGMFCDASAANGGHSLTAGCTSSRVGRRQSLSWTHSYLFAVPFLHDFSKAPSHIRNSSFTLSPNVLHTLNSACWKTTAKVQPSSNYTNSSESGCGIAASFPHLQVASGVSAWFYLFIITFPLDVSPPHF